MWEKLLDVIDSFLDVLYPAFIGRRGVIIFITLLIVLLFLSLLLRE